MDGHLRQWPGGYRPGRQIYEIPTYYVFEYRDMDVAGAWTVIELEKFGGSLGAQGFTERIFLPYAMRPEARVRKLYKDRPGRINDEARDDATWTDLRGRMLNSPISYPGLTVMTCNIREGIGYQPSLKARSMWRPPALSL